MPPAKKKPAKKPIAKAKASASGKAAWSAATVKAAAAQARTATSAPTKTSEKTAPRPVQQATAITINKTTTKGENTMSKQSNTNNPFNASAAAFMPNWDEMSNQARANMDATMQSFTTMSNGFSTMTQQMTAIAQTMAQMTVSAMQAATGARTLREMTDLQNDYAKTSFDTLVGKATEMSELTMKIANDATGPISQRLNETMERFGKAA